MGRIRFCWVSRHELNELNMEILNKAAEKMGYDEWDYVQFADTVNDVQELIDFANEYNCDAYIVVLPPNLIMQLMQKDKKPVYRFVVDRVLDDKGNATFIPIGLELIKEIKIVTERIV